ncbi:MULTISPECIES: DUF6113 family protein [unclassified Streptomyces]|uniref:DUF6113 family protein n=1 Tax=unclassified Streptomyces TaxID=2593676 RepID=UPI0006AF649A|nr:MULTISPECIES: DUF6113 family protein [unclassified Streptomyces]
MSPSSSSPNSSPNPPSRGRAASPGRPAAGGPPPAGSARSGPASDGLPVSRTARYVWYGLLFVLGALVGTAGALVQAAWLPAGLLLALLATGGLFYGGLRATGTQVGVAAAGGGWLVAVVLLSFGRPEGDGVFGGGVGELLFLFGGMGIAVMCTTLARLPRPPR